MRHGDGHKKLGRSSSHRKALMASLVCNLIAEERIETTLAKAKQARSLAEKLTTKARKDSVAARRLVVAELRQNKAVAKLFSDIAPRYLNRQGGYTRIVKTGRRTGDGSSMAILEWVAPVEAENVPAPGTEEAVEVSEAVDG